MSGTERGEVAAVVLNHRRADDTIRCVESLRASEGIRPRIIVVDNGSGDDSAERIEAACPGIELIRSASNRGYAGGNNLGISAALRGGAEQVLVLNNDCVVAPDTLYLMVEAARRLGADIVSPKVLDFGKRGVIQYAGYRNIHILAQGVPVGEGERDTGGFSEEREMNAAPGCAMLLSRRLCEEVGLFDEQFFAYSEELDLCRRARRKGLTIVFVPRARVWHEKAATLSEGSPDYVYHLTRGRLIYARKHLGWPAFLFVFLPYFISVKIVKPCILYLLKRRCRNIKALWRAVGWNLRNRVRREGLNVKLR
ncbi:TPA: glycosyltransferase family 2 protein [Candidatus Bipolaricaulota bacterium]|nr:glycosyltransferase family 2 protein [Candidatus Bipolaricaulota bacterium]